MTFVQREKYIFLSAGSWVIQEDMTYVRYKQILIYPLLIEIRPILASKSFL